MYPAEKDLLEHGLLALPVAITGISPIVNLPKVPNAQLRLTGEVLSRIFMGEITRWNAADIAALNPDLPLPDLPIKVVVRADGPGTTYNFADYLGKVSPQWKNLRRQNQHCLTFAGVLAFKGGDGVPRACATLRAPSGRWTTATWPNTA